MLYVTKRIVIRFPHAVVLHIAIAVLTLCSRPLFSQNVLPDSIVLPIAVIQATRAETRNPVPHTDFSAAAIARNHQAQDVPFLLSSVPSVVETSDAGAGVGYTGMRIRGSDPTRINVTINGIPFNDAESQGVFWVNLPDLAASAAEIQVQRGVGTSTNGAGAFGASVNLDLSKVQTEPFATVASSVGSFGLQKYSAYAGTGLLPGKVAFSGRLSTIQSDGYVDRASADLQSFHLTGAYLDDRQILQAHLISGHEITYQAWYGLPAQYLDNPRLRTYNPAGTEQVGTPYANEVDNYTQRHLLLHYQRSLSKNMTLQLNGHYTRGYGFYEQYKAAAAFDAYGLPSFNLGDTTVEVTDLVRRRWLDNHFYGSTFALRWSPTVQFKPVFLLGGAVSRYQGKHYGEITWAQIAVNIPKDYRYYENDADKRDGNIYLKTELNFTRNFSAFIDLQTRAVQYTFLGFDNAQNNVDQSVNLLFFNPKIGINWQFAPNWTANGFAGIAHREPNRDDYTQSTPASRPQAERLFDLETGVKTGHKTWNASVNFFWMQYYNQLVLDGRLNDVGAYIRTNVPNSYRAGIELEAAVQVLPQVTLSGNTTLSHNKVRGFTEYRDNWDTGAQDTYVYQNSDLAFSPNATARGEIAWQILPATAKHALAIAWSGKYVGTQFLDNTANAQTTLPAYFFSDVRLNYDLKKVIGAQVSVILAVNNVFDARYVSNGWTYRYTSTGYDARPDNAYTRLEGATTYNQTGYFPQAGRNWMATIRLMF